MKKKLILLMAAVLALYLCACGSHAEEIPETTVEITKAVEQETTIPKTEPTEIEVLTTTEESVAETEPVATNPPATHPPATNPPATEAPATNLPEMEFPATNFPEIDSGSLLPEDEF